MFFPSDEELVAMKESTGRTAQKKYDDFVTWWTGGDLRSGYGEHRLAFLQREALYACRQPAVRAEAVKVSQRFFAVVAMHC